MQYLMNTNPIQNNDIMENQPVVQNQMNEEYDSESESEGEGEEEGMDIEDNYYHSYTQKYYNIVIENHVQKSTEELNQEVQYTIHLCMYKIMMNSVEPYLLYFMQKDSYNSSIEFPKYNFQMKSIAQPLASDNNIIGQMDAEFEDLLFQQIRMYMQGGESINIEELYKGFRYFTNPISNEIIVFVDATTLPIQYVNLFKVSVYELLCSKKVFEINVNEKIPLFFQQLSENEQIRDFHHVMNISTGKYVETPYCLFLCSKNTMGNYISVAKTEIIQNEIATLILGKIQHPILGSYLLFTNKPQGILFGSYETLRRFVVFSMKENTAFIEGDLKLSEVFSDDSPNYSAITFMENNIQLWAVGSSLFVAEIM